MNNFYNLEYKNYNKCYHFYYFNHFLYNNKNFNKNKQTYYNYTFRISQDT